MYPKITCYLLALAAVMATGCTQQQINEVQNISSDELSDSDRMAVLNLVKSKSYEQYVQLGKSHDDKVQRPPKSYAKFEEQKEPVIDALESKVPIQLSGRNYMVSIFTRVRFTQTACTYFDNQGYPIKHLVKDMDLVNQPRDTWYRIEPGEPTVPNLRSND